MIPDRPTLLVWGLTALLIGATALGAWMLSGENIDGLLALIERLNTEANSDRCLLPSFSP